MIRCLPQGICSWNYRLEGDGHSGETGLQVFRNGGELVVDGVWMQISKQGLLPASWELANGAGPIARASKPNPFTRRMEGHGPGGAFVLAAESAFGRTMSLEMPGGRAVISPDHPFTRRATITGDVRDFTTLCFAFWLTAWMWRRTANNSAGAS